MRELGLRIQRAVEAEARLGRVDWSTTLTVTSKLQLSSAHSQRSQGAGGIGGGGDLHSSARSAYSSHMTSANGNALGAIIPSGGDQGGSHSSLPPGGRPYPPMGQGQGLVPGQGLGNSQRSLGPGQGLGPGLSSSQRSLGPSVGGFGMGVPYDVSNELANMDKYPPDEVVRSASARNAHNASSCTLS